MKRFVIWFCLAVCTFCAAAAAVPNVGNGRLRVLGNNLQNYYYNYAESSRPSYSTDEGRAEKTRKIVNMMLQANADIYAFCEVEAKPIVLQQLADSLNKTAGVTYYKTIDDGIYVETDSYDNALKSGFIYRSDKVEPYYSNYPATNVTYYCNVMRIQAWTEMATGEHFVLSMNHFKAKSDEASIAKRVDNANWLKSGLNNSSKVKDSDILIMGDLNCGMSEEAISIIQDAGFTEQLLAYDANAYTYCYQGTEEFIDHVFANASMASQITGAAVWHYNTTCGGTSNSANRYSDHDPYLVAINLGGALPGGDCTAIDFSESFASGLGDFTQVSVLGSSSWFWKSDYTCAYINAYSTCPDDDYLVSPAFDFTDQKSGTISFTHALGYGTASNWPNQCSLLISSDYTDDVTSATWTPLTIPSWPTTNWSWQSNVITIPTAFMHKSNVHFAFRYNVESSAPAWEIKELSVSTVCEKDTAMGTEIVPVDGPCKKILHNGMLIIERGGVQYTITGQRLY